MALLKLLIVTVLITLGPVIRKLFTDLKGREGNESHDLTQAQEHPPGMPLLLNPTMLLR